MNARLPLLLAGLGALGTLGACAGVPRPAPGMAVASHADTHEIAVTETQDRLEVVFEHGMTRLSTKSRNDIAMFAEEYQTVGHGSLVMSTPSGGSNADDASLMAQQTRLALVDAGVPYAAIAGSTYDASGTNGAPIILTFTRYEAEAPHCRPIYEQDLGHQSNNQPWESFGCATQANLAAEIEDPHDLIAPRDETARDSGRRDVVMQNYRNGQHTHAERTSDERINVSTVAQ